MQLISVDVMINVVKNQTFEKKKWVTIICYAEYIISKQLNSHRKIFSYDILHGEIFLEYLSRIAHYYNLDPQDIHDNLFLVYYYSSDYIGRITGGMHDKTHLNKFQTWGQY